MGEGDIKPEESKEATACRCKWTAVKIQPFVE
jgi:hypothetical protein